MAQLSQESPWRHERTFLAVLVVLALLMRLYRIGAQSLWVDEMLTLGVSSPKDGLHIWSYLKFNIHGPLHAFVVYLFQLVSAADGWLRLPSALAGAAAVPYLYLWVRSWIGRSTARIATVLLAVHPLHIHYSQELRNYSFLILFALMACCYFERMQRSGRRLHRSVYVVSVACAALSNFATAFLFAVHTVVYFRRRRIRRSTLVRWGVIALAVLVLISPWVYRVYTFIDVSDLVTPVRPGQLDESRRLRGETTVTPAAIPYTFYTFSAGFSLGPSTRELHVDRSVGNLMDRHAAPVIWVALLFGVVFVLGVRAAIVRRAPWGEMLLYLCVPVALTIVLNWQNAKAFNIRYVLVAFPAFLCFLAVGIDSLGGWRRPALATAVLATMLWSDANYYHNGRFARDDVRGAVRYVENHIERNECIFAPTVESIVRHYYGGIETILTVYNPPGYNGERLETRLAAVFAECKRVWYIRARPWVDDADGRVLASFRSYYTKEDIVYFDGVELFHFTGKKGGD